MGACALADVGTDPRDDCPDDGVATCGRDGLCDGSGACRHYPIGAVCQAPSLPRVDAHERVSLRSDGTCRPTSGQPCDPYRCNPTGSDCLLTSARPARTASPAPSATAAAAATRSRWARRARSATTATARPAQQGFAATPRAPGPAESCALAGAAGTCTDVPAGEDPLEQCADGGRASCGTDGTCDGKGRAALTCRGRSARTRPAPAPTGTAQGRCDGTGTCVVGPPVACGTCTSASLTDGGGGLHRWSPRACAPVVPSQCVNQGIASCGTDGTCNGAGACRLYPSGTVCAAAPARPARPTRRRALCNGAGDLPAVDQRRLPRRLPLQRGQQRLQDQLHGRDLGGRLRWRPTSAPAPICGTVRVQYRCGDANATTRARTRSSS